MLTGASFAAIAFKMIPYILTIKIVGGIVDIGVHIAKTKIK